MDKKAGELYWDHKKDKAYTKVISSKVGPQHDKIVILTPEDGGENQQFTLEFFEQLVRTGKITKIK